MDRHDGWQALAFTVRSTCASTASNTSLRAHRAMAQLFEEKPLDPEHETVEHLCDNPLCVNPDHFELIDRVDNSLRSIMEKPRGIWNG